MNHLVLFVMSCVLLHLTPGPDVLFVVSKSLRNDAARGVIGALGVSAGCFVHIAAASIGLSALIAASAHAFTALKWIGAAYLLWVGLKMAFTRDVAPEVAPASTKNLIAESKARIFRQGFLTNALNPKVALFFLAFMPQFIAQDASSKSLQFVLLGCLFSLSAFAVNSGWAFAAAWTASRVSAVKKLMRWIERCAGVLFIGFGLRLAWSDLPSPSVSITK